MRSTKREVGLAKKWGISVFHYPQISLPTDFDQISHEGSPWDVAHHVSQTRKRGRTTEKVEKKWGKLRF
jgi:hypothetical protein